LPIHLGVRGGWYRSKVSSNGSCLLSTKTMARCSPLKKPRELHRQERPGHERAASVSGNRKGAILVTLPRLVYVEEDRFQTLFSDP
jgi:hypothetical protein